MECMDRTASRNQQRTFRRPHYATSQQEVASPRVDTRLQTACQTCVGRGIRCSEQKPICRECEDHQRACKWPQAEPRTTPSLTASTSHFGRTPSPPDRPRKRVKRSSPEYTYDQGQSHLFRNNMERRRSDGPLLPAIATGYPVFTRKVSPKSRRLEPLTPLSKARSKTTSLSSTISTASTSMQLVPDGNYSPKNLAGGFASPLVTLKPQPMSAPTWPTRALLQIQPVAINASMLFRPDLGGERRPSQLVCPAPMDLQTFCHARGDSQSSTTLGLLRKTYLARFTAGAYEMAFLNTETAQQTCFTHIIIPFLDAIDPDTTIVLQDPLRLQNPLECSIFQEAYVRSLKQRTLDGQSDILRRWAASLFLLGMSLERGLMSHVHYHSEMAVFCFRLLNVKARFTGDVRKPVDACLLFLSEATFRYAANVALLTGDRSPIEASTLPGPTLPFDQLMRQTVVQRLQAFDLLKQLAVTVSVPERSAIASRLETTLADIMACEREIDRQPTVRTPPNAAQPFGSVAFQANGWAAAAMQLTIVKVLISSLVDGFHRAQLLLFFFAVFEGVLASSAPATNQAKITLDATGLLLLGAMLQDPAQRQCFCEGLAKAASRAFGAALPFVELERILNRVWQMQDAKSPYEPLPNSHFTAAFLRDISIIRDVQVVYGERMGERRGLLAF